MSILYLPEVRIVGGLLFTGCSLCLLYRPVRESGVMYGERRKPGLQKKRSKTKPENSKKADKYDIIELSTPPEETATRSLSEDLGKIY